jgi:predicted Zn-dependent protease
MFICCISTFGCATSPRRSTSVWVNAHGGLLPAESAAQARIASVSQPLTAACNGRTITVNVLATDAVTAYSLRDGHIFVTRGLLDHLSDAELQAAVAHELGHLLSDGHLQTVASLNGCCVNPDQEVRADAVGARLLKSEGLQPRAMLSMLKKVKRFGSLSPSCATAVQRRIELLAASTDAQMR